MTRRKVIRDISDRTTIPFLPTREIYLEICHWNETHSRADPIHVHTSLHRIDIRGDTGDSAQECTFTPDSVSRPCGLHAG